MAQRPHIGRSLPCKKKESAINRITTALAVAGTAAALAPAGAGAAAKLPAGKYTCTYYSYSYGTTFSNFMRVFRDRTYNADGGRKKKGRFVYRGERIVFKTGPYKGVYFGKWERGSGTEKELHLYATDDPSDYLLSCY